jgi:hypothetical protein
MPNEDSLIGGSPSRAAQLVSSKMKPVAFVFPLNRGIQLIGMSSGAESVMHERSDALVVNHAGTVCSWVARASAYTQNATDKSRLVKGKSGCPV